MIRPWFVLVILLPACRPPLATTEIDRIIAETGRFPVAYEALQARCYRELGEPWSPGPVNYRAVLADPKLQALSRREGGPPPFWVAFSWIIIGPGVLNSDKLRLDDPYWASAIAHEFYHVYQFWRDGTGGMLRAYAWGVIVSEGQWLHDRIPMEREAMAFQARARAWFERHRSELKEAVKR